MAKKKAPRRSSKPAARAARKPARKAKARRAKTRSSRRAAPAKKAPANKAPARKAAAKTPVAAKKAPARRPMKKVAAKKAANPAAAVVEAVKVAAPKSSRRPKRPPSLDRTRKTVGELHGVPSSLDAGSFSSAAKSGQAEMQHKLRQHSSSSPALTAGDVDADWESAESTGDEAPGGDNPTPDQDVVEEIGRALGVEYADDEELQGGDEITERDRHRWELDPNSKDDFEDTE